MIVDMYVIVGVENLIHILAHGLPCTYRPDPNSEERVARPFYFNRDDAVTAAIKMQSVGERWAGKPVAVLCVSVLKTHLDQDLCPFTTKIFTVKENVHRAFIQGNAFLLKC